MLYVSKLVLVVLLLVAILVLLLIKLVKHIFNCIFKKNCYKCKHCYLHSVPGYGNGSTYKCDIKEKNRTITTGIDNGYTFCKDYITN